MPQWGTGLTLEPEGGSLPMLTFPGQGRLATGARFPRNSSQLLSPTLPPQLLQLVVESGDCETKASFRFRLQHLDVGSKPLDPLKDQAPKLETISGGKAMPGGRNCFQESSEQFLLAPHPHIHGSVIISPEVTVKATSPIFSVSFLLLLPILSTYSSVHRI